jgi:hypothetical protein
MPQRYLDRLTSIDAAFPHQKSLNSHMHLGGVLVVGSSPPDFVDYPDDGYANS